MPSENFHEQEIEADGEFVRIRRQSDKFGSGIDASFGVTPGGDAVLKVIFFDKDKFTPAEAKEWLKEHDHPTSGFTEATGEEMSFHREKDKKKKRSELAGFAKGVEILRPGVFDSITGEEKVTAKDLRDIVRNFAEFPDVPQFLGHDEKSKILKMNTDTPAAGWAQRFFIKAGILFADIGDIPDTVVRWIESKAFKKVSLGFDRDDEKGAIAKHIGLLGATPPAVKGLADYPEITFASGGFSASTTVILARGDETMPQHITREEAITILKDAGMPSSVYAETVSDEDVIKAADAVIAMRRTDLQGEEAESAATKVGTEIADKIAEQIPEEVAEKVTPEVAEKVAEMVVAEVAKEVEETVEETGEESVAMAKAQKQLAKAERVATDALKALKDEKRERGISMLSQKIADLVETGRMAPAEVENFKAFAGALLDIDEPAEVMLAAQDGGEEKLSLYNAAIRLAESRPRNKLTMELGEDGEPREPDESGREEVTEKAKSMWASDVELQKAYPKGERKDRFVENYLLTRGYKIEKQDKADSKK